MPATIIQGGSTMNGDGGYAKMQVFCSCLGQVSVNTVYYSYGPAAGAIPSAGQVAAAFSDWIRDAYLPLLNQDARYMGVKVTDVTPGKPLPGIAVEEGAGTQATGALPLQTAGVVTLQSTLSDPQGRGRIYVPFPGIGAQDADAHPTVDYLSSLVLLGIGLRAFVTATYDPAGSNSFELKVFSKTANIFRKCVSTRGNRRWGEIHKRGDYGKANIPVIT